MRAITGEVCYKAEHVIDLESEVIVAAQIYAGDAADGTTLVPSVRQAEAHLERAATTCRPSIRRH